MRKRLYFLLPNLEEAKKTVDELLLARIDDQHIHVMAKDGIDLGDLPEATIFQTSDIVHGVETGMVIGGISGLVGSIIAITALQVGSVMGLVVLGCTIFGAGFGIWTSGMIGSSAKNSRLKEFEQSMNEGKILLMTDVPMEKVEVITQKMEAHKHTVLGGSDPSIPAFP
ncbi:MAG: DUF1269 domain-containing protein [endosymbiont of Galathealinum brachiosum]|uniref:DUF1269 domain-containing protein n=1 Tax=endosymbiont of Galathealinum brachiosum TaxID=2200906 RepID=A0A370DFW4_9GAMM|nr:MAG: DUF1269 domain-containing protein [endosymbiont of Galathealinum brachiosum]